VKRSALLVALLLPWMAWAEPVTYRIDPARTFAEFEVDHLGVFQAQGRFAHVTGTLHYDAAAQSGAIDLTIPVSSVATGWDSRDQFLRGASMFDAAHFPSMRFVSKGFEFEGGRLVRVQGELTLRDVTQPVTLSVSTIHCEWSACVADASASIRRRAFALDAWWPIIGDDVDLRLRVVATAE
jgi:polyisoprenoid-binding protein YceI